MHTVAESGNDHCHSLAQRECIPFIILFPSYWMLERIDRLTLMQ